MQIFSTILLGLWEVLNGLQAAKRKGRPYPKRKKPAAEPATEAHDPDFEQVNDTIIHDSVTDDHT